MSARKDDTDKPPISLIPRSAIMAMARVMAAGAKKYGRQNWRSNDGLAWSRVIDAAMRHMMAFADGEDFDNEEGGSKELHLANAMCCMAFLIEYYDNDIGEDDRFKREAQSQPATTDIYKYYKVIASGGTGTDVVLAVFTIREVAENWMHKAASDWPTFTLFIQEEYSSVGHT